MRHLLIILISILLLSSPVFGQSSKYESVNQCVLHTMKENKLTGNYMFKMVKEECERSMGSGGSGDKKKGVLYLGRVNGKLGWYKNRINKKDSKYVGEVKNGLPHGQGTITSTYKSMINGELEVREDGLKHLVEYKNGKEISHRFIKEKGVLFQRKVNEEWEWYRSGDERKDSKYVGEIEYRNPDGRGTVTLPDGTKLIGEWKSGEFDGQGILTLTNGDYYEGKWSEGKIYEGTSFINGEKYVGTWKQSRFWNGILYDDEGNLLEKIVNGVVQNKLGVVIEKKEKVVMYQRKVNGEWGWYKSGNEKKDTKYVGEWKNGKKNGQGITTFPDGDYYEGKWFEGKIYEGTSSIGVYKYIGTWKMNKEWNGTHYDKDGIITGKTVNGVREW